MSEAQATAAPPAARRAGLPALAWPSVRQCAGVLIIAGAYFGTAKVGQTLRYTASVSAIWPPAGFGIAVLYLFGLRWWPGIFLGELLVNGQLLLEHTSIPVGSLVGQQAGNMAEVIVGAWLLRRLIGPRAALALLTAVGVSSGRPVTYVVFPALIWAAFRFGPPGVTLSTAITAGMTIGITADRVGVFFKQPIDDRTLSTQLYVLVAALTPLFLSAVISERERSAVQLVEARRRETERALEERRRIARELHDSVSQALFSSVLHTRAAQKALESENGDQSERLRQTLETIDGLTKQAQSEMRRFIFEWGPRGIGDDLVPAFKRHASSSADDAGLAVEVVA